MRSRAAFVGLGFHLKTTKSTDFFIDIMRGVFPGVEVFSEEWSWVKLPRRRSWDTVVFFQHPPSRLLLDSVTIRNVILVPMYDTCSLEKTYWDAYRDCGIVCFSTTLAALLEGWGHRVIRVRYAPEVAARTDWSGGVRGGFFWPRKPNLSWKVVRQLLEGQTWDGFHLHVTENDPALVDGLDEQARDRFRIRQTSWFRHRTEYQTVLADCQVFFAPRRTEGIGMAFLEAMAMGMAVVSPDGATMNEYIDSGVTGYLYDPDHPQAPDWTQAPQWGQNAREVLGRWRREWLESLPALGAFLQTAGPDRPEGRMTPEAWAERRPVWRRYRWFRLANPLRWLKARLIP